MGAYTTYQSVAPNAASTYELLDTRPSVRERRGCRRARRRARQPGVRGCDIRLHAGPNRFSTGCPSRSPKARPWRWWAVPGRGSRRCSTSCCDSWSRSEAGFCSTATTSRESPSRRFGTRFPSSPSSRSSPETRSERTSGWPGRTPTDAEIEEACEEAHVHSIIIGPHEAARRLRHGGGRAGPVRRTEEADRAGALPVA